MMTDHKPTWEEVNRNVALFLEALKEVGEWHRQTISGDQPPPNILEGIKVIEEFFGLKPPESFLQLLHEAKRENFSDALKAIQLATIEIQTDLNHTPWTKETASQVESVTPDGF